MQSTVDDSSVARNPSGAEMMVRIDSTWDGDPIDGAEVAEIRLRVSPLHLEVRVAAPYHGDPPPLGPAGPTAKLWEFEVVELFLLGGGERYLELEFSPHGHYLALQLEGRRRVAHEGLEIAYRAARTGPRWFGWASVPFELLPADVKAINGYAIHGLGDQRRYLAAEPTGGDAPDFHQLDGFASLPRDFRAALDLRV